MSFSPACEMKVRINLPAPYEGSVIKIHTVTCNEAITILKNYTLESNTGVVVDRLTIIYSNLSSFNSYGMSCKKAENIIRCASKVEDAIRDCRDDDMKSKL